MFALKTFPQIIFQSLDFSKGKNSRNNPCNITSTGTVFLKDKPTETYRTSQGIEQRVHEKIRVRDHSLKIHVILRHISYSFNF